MTQQYGKWKNKVLSKTASKYIPVHGIWVPVFLCYLGPHFIAVYANPTIFFFVAMMTNALRKRSWASAKNLLSTSACFSFQDLIVFSFLPGTTSYLITRKNDPLTSTTAIQNLHQIVTLEMPMASKNESRSEGQKDKCISTSIAYKLFGSFLGLQKPIYKVSFDVFIAFLLTIFRLPGFLMYRGFQCLRLLPGFAIHFIKCWTRNNSFLPLQTISITILLSFYYSRIPVRSAIC